jgi:hypothetical protein
VSTAIVGSPRAWRLSTIGGWNWQAHLTLADALNKCLPNNPEFADYLNEVGVFPGTGDTTSSDPFKPINLH